MRRGIVAQDDGKLKGRDPGFFANFAVSWRTLRLKGFDLAAKWQNLES
jgi:hypothetical protein